MRVLIVAALLLGTLGAFAETADAEPGPCGPNVDRCEPPALCGWPPSDPVDRVWWLVACVAPP